MNWIKITPETEDSIPTVLILANNKREYLAGYLRQEHNCSWTCFDELGSILVDVTHYCIITPPTQESPKEIEDEYR